MSSRYFFSLCNISDFFKVFANIASTFTCYRAHDGTLISNVNFCFFGLFYCSTLLYSMLIYFYCMPFYYSFWGRVLLESSVLPKCFEFTGTLLPPTSSPPSAPESTPFFSDCKVFPHVLIFSCLFSIKYRKQRHFI